MRKWMVAAVLSLSVTTGVASADFVNFETPQVNPIALSPDGAILAVCNTADGHVEFFDVSATAPESIGSVLVGLDPVSVRFRTATEVWVVNQISDTVSVVDLTAGVVVATLRTGDEPADVVFAGTPPRAFVTCSAINTVQVFDPIGLGAPIAQAILDAEDPRALAVSPEGDKVYAAIFESGNGTSILGGGHASDRNVFPPNVVDDADTPHGGVAPHPNNGDSFFPPRPADQPAPPRVSLIVRQGEDGRWRDDTGDDWTDWVSGEKAPNSGRPVGWTLLDNDVAVIDADTLNVSYIERLMNANMHLAVHPISGEVTVVGLDATNEIRFEPVLRGTFVRVLLAMADEGGREVIDLNGGHLDYETFRVPQSQRDLSVGDPRAIQWLPNGSRAYVAGMGSNNLVVVGADGERVGSPIEIGEGPTGLALNETSGLLYVLNRFDAEVAVVDTADNSIVARVPFYDATPEVIRMGRRHLYDTHETSGLGQASCAACHIDARFDRLSWDLGAPNGSMTELDGLNLGGGIPGVNLLQPFQPFHPMKGPMTTQTLQGIIGREPLHWRGDKRGLEEFNPVFMGLHGDDEQLTDAEMQAFEDYLATITFPPNPFRNPDNTLPDDLPLDGHFATGRFALDEGDPLPNGNAQRGLDLYRDSTRLLDRRVASCVLCHALPGGDGTSTQWNGSEWVPMPVGPKGEKNLMLVSADGFTNVTMKVPHLRNLYDKVGMNMSGTTSRAGFGFGHDGSFDSIERFLAEPVFRIRNDQELSDLTALMLAFSGSDFNVTPAAGPLEPPGEPSKDVHAAVGLQVTLSGASPNLEEAQALVTLVNGSERIKLIGHGVLQGEVRSGLLTEEGTVQLDRAGETIAAAQLFDAVQLGGAFTLTVVPAGTGERLALDRDRDGIFNFDEEEAGTDPANPNDPGPGAEGEGEGGPADRHSADFEAPFGAFSLSELLRVIQFFNVGGFCCAVDRNTEDGYVAEACEARACTPHRSDYDGGADWTISLTELLRAIQIFNSGGYVACPGEDTEDGFCPTPATL